MLTLTLINVSVVAFAERRQVQIIHADAARGLKHGDASIQRLIGNVELMHNGATMTCDSAYLYPDNRFEAFSRVVVRRDTLYLYGDYMDYESATDIGKVRGRMVTLLDGATRLRTQYLDFNTATDVAFFFNGGSIDRGENLLESNRGFYHSNQKLAIFHGKVDMKNAEYIIKSDSLHYLTNQDIATFFKRTNIWHDDIFLSMRHGYYERAGDHFFLADSVYMMSEKQESWSDSAHYYRTQKEGEMFDNVQLFDSAQNAMVLGDYAKLYEDRDLAFVTKQPVGVFFSTNVKDDTMFLKADTLLVRREINTDTLTLEIDSTLKYMQAFHNVQFYHPQIQGACDSMSYSAIDSLTEMFFNPILWNDVNQITGDKINIYQKNNEIHQVEVMSAGFIAMLDDSLKSYYNQIKGKLIVANFEQNELYRVDVYGAGQSIYYLRDKEKLSGVNKSASNDIKIYVKDRKIHRINYLESPESDVIPPKDIDVRDLTLKGFSWQENRRPHTRFDITTRSVKPSQRQSTSEIEQPAFAITHRLDEVKTGFFPPTSLLKKLGR